MCCSGLPLGLEVGSAVAQPILSSRATSCSVLTLITLTAKI
jgi:hypothetical protein